MTNDQMLKGCVLIFLPWLLGVVGVGLLAYNVGALRERGRWLQLVPMVAHKYLDHGDRGLLRLLDACADVARTGWSRIGRDYPVPTQAAPPPPPQQKASP